MSSGPGQTTQLLIRLEEGDESALEQLLPLVYAELRRLAGGLLRHERAGHTLQATALVHEAYLRLAGSGPVSAKSRAHFLGVAARVMRQVLVDHARARRAEKRGGGEIAVPLDEGLAKADEKSQALLALDDALKDLATLDKRKADVIEMRYFGGLSGEEISEALGISLSTVTRDLRMAESWLAQHMGAPPVQP